MPNFNPMERNSLMNLMAALGSGMTGSDALTQFQNILNAQQGRVAANKEANGSLIDLLAGSAAQGGSLQSARAIAGAYDPGKTLPPAIRDALNSLYPQDANGTPGTMDAQTGYHPGTPAVGPASNFSPTYQPPPMTPQDQLNYQLGQQQLAAGQQEASMQPDPVQIAGTYKSAVYAAVGQNVGVQDLINGFIVNAPDDASRAIAMSPQFQQAIVEMYRKAKAETPSTTTNPVDPTNPNASQGDFLNTGDNWATSPYNPDNPAAKV